MPVKMLNVFPRKTVVALTLVLTVFLVGCIHEKTKRGHIVRGDWAVEYNRTPWIGCQADADCADCNGTENGERKNLFSCLKNGSDRKERRAFRRHCATTPRCTSEEPCCRTLGCGMWVEPTEEGAIRVCGLTPFCFTQKPCGLTPNCGKPANQSVNPQTMMQPNQPILGELGNVLNVLGGNVPLGQSGVPTMRGMPPGSMSPGMMSSGMMSSGMMSPGMMSPGMMSNVPAPGVMPGTLVSRGIVPGASAITSGGMVAAIGVATPSGTMTPVGVRMPNGMVSNTMVLRACVMSPNCTAARPCGTTPHCGGAVAVNLVANNAIVLASALQGQGVASGVMQVGGMVNPMMGQPMMNQPMMGQMMAAAPQMGQVSAAHIQHASGMVVADEVPVVEEKVEFALPETRSQMPVPRFHPIPTQPTFQRSEGMTPTPSAQRTTAMSETLSVSEHELEAALDQAYLQGVAAAMDDVERKLEEKRLAVAKAKLEERILQQAEAVQQQLDEQARMQMLAMQRMQQERHLRQQTAAEPILEPQHLPPRLPTPKQSVVAQTPPQRMTQSPTVAVAMHNNASVTPAQLAENLKASVASGVNEVFGTLLNSTPKGQPPIRMQTSLPASASTNPKVITQPAVQPTVQSQSTVQSEVAVTPPNLPGRPPVASVPRDFGLLPDNEPVAPILQAQFTAY